jgi:streptomycin 6-kinase
VAGRGTPEQRRGLGGASSISDFIIAMRSRIHIPARLTATCVKRPEHAAWVARLPEILTRLGRQWSLTFGPPFDADEASCSWVAPVELADGAPAVFKVGLPHMESEGEIAGLRFWDGDPTVRLLRAHDETGAMLLERCEPGTALRAVPPLDQDVVIARLLRRAWRPPGVSHAFRPLSAMLAAWSGETLAAAERWPDAEIVREGLRLFRELPTSASDDVVLVTDLHAGNVLRARREPWLAIDPKPFVGDPAYDATQHLLNGEARLRSDPHETIRRFADLLSVDDERVRLWVFARAAAGPRGDWTADWTMELARAIAP